LEPIWADLLRTNTGVDWREGQGTDWAVLQGLNGLGICMRREILCTGPGLSARRDGAGKEKSIRAGKGNEPGLERESWIELA